MVALPEARRTMELENKVPKSYFSFCSQLAVRGVKADRFPPGVPPLQCSLGWAKEASVLRTGWTGTWRAPRCASWTSFHSHASWSIPALCAVLFLETLSHAILQNPSASIFTFTLVWEFRIWTRRTKKGSSSSATASKAVVNYFALSVRTVNCNRMALAPERAEWSS